MKKREGIQLCYPFEEKRLNKWDFPCIVQPKLDGERCRALICGDGLDGVKLLSSELNEITSVPHIRSAIASLHLPKGTELDGELYRHGWTFEEIHSIVSRQVNFHPRFTQMEYHVFDVIYEGNLEEIQGQRLMRYKEMNLKHPLIPVPFHAVGSLEEIMENYNYYLDQDYEGIILRNIFYPYERRRSTGIMKFKPKKLDHYQILECFEAVDKHGNAKNMLGGFLCVGFDGTEFKVGAGTLTHDQRYEIWQERNSYAGMVCEVQYQNITSNGVPRFGLCFKKPTEVWANDESPFDILKLRR